MEVRRGDGSGERDAMRCEAVEVVQTAEAVKAMEVVEVEACCTLCLEVECARSSPYRCTVRCLTNSERDRQTLGQY